MTPEVPGQLDALDLVAEAVNMGTSPRNAPAPGAGEAPPVSGRLPRLGADGQPSGAAEGKDAGDHA